VHAFDGIVVFIQSDKKQKLIGGILPL